jgi:hypothetical protein
MHSQQTQEAGRTRSERYENLRSTRPKSNNIDGDLDQQVTRNCTPSQQDLKVPTHNTARPRQDLKALAQPMSSGGKETSIAAKRSRIMSIHQTLNNRRNPREEPQKRVEKRGITKTQSQIHAPTEDEPPTSPENNRSEIINPDDAPQMHHKQSAT